MGLPWGFHGSPVGLECWPMGLPYINGFRMGLPWGFEGTIALPRDSHGAPVNGPPGAAVGTRWASHSESVRMGLP